MSRLTKRRALFVALACAATAMVFQAMVRAAAPAGRYTLNAGTVVDNRTKLTWQQAPASSTMIGTGAKAYCTSSAVSAALGGSGWRLPTEKELQTLVDDSVARPGPTIDSTYFPSTPADLFWSSTLAGTNPSYAWLIQFKDGSTATAALTEAHYVRCVR